MKVLMTGTSGMIGGAARSTLIGEGHQVTALVRRTPAGPEDLRWDPDKGEIDAWRLYGHDAVVHLGGEPIAEGRWTEEKKARIRSSRAGNTRFLAETLAKMPHPPKVMVSASAVGFYGDRGDQTLTEESGPGGGFLTDVCRTWEEATAPAKDAGVRVVNLRIGVVLSALGGALPKMLLPFKMGVGGRLGDGKQWMSWISLEDIVGTILFSILNEKLEGPVNAVSPEPVTNADFTKQLGRALYRPTIFPVPAFAARLALGEMADELFFASAKVLPKKLQEASFPFQHQTLTPLLRQLVRT